MCRLTCLLFIATQEASEWMHVVAKAEVEKREADSFMEVRGAVVLRNVAAGNVVPRCKCFAHLLLICACSKHTSSWIAPSGLPAVQPS